MGERSGKPFSLGDSIKIQVARVDLDQRQIDFVLEEELRGNNKKNNKKKRNVNRAHKTNKKNGKKRSGRKPKKK
jgi:ribonuclease R